MATFLDITLIEKFSSIISMLFVWVVVYAVMQSTGVFGKNKGLHSLIAFCVSLFVLLSPDVNTLITTMSPWFVVLFLVIMFILVGVKMMGVSDSMISQAFAKGKLRNLIYWVVTFSILIVLYGLSQGFGQDIGPYLGEEGAEFDSNATLTLPNELEGGSVASEDFNQNLSATIFHPKILGLIVVFLIASFAIRALSRS